MAATFHRIEQASATPSNLRGGVVAIGNFDGVHRGHQSVLEMARDLAREKNVPALVLTFEPHPASVFRPARPLFRLTPAPLKSRLIEAEGFDAVVEERFTREFAARSPQAFVEDILVGGLGAGHVVTGYDFHYGKDRGGTAATLEEAGAAHGFGVTIAQAFCDEGGETVSSTRIRAALAQGDPAGAAALLGYRFTVRAKIEGGKQLGRTLGYPTANMALSPDADIAHGIYAVRFRTAAGTLHDGVASFGRRPTVDVDGAPLLETFLFDFSGDLYGQICEVSLFAYLRGEEKFDGLDALTAQMRRDEEEARAVLARVEPLSPLDRLVTFRDARASG